MPVASNASTDRTFHWHDLRHTCASYMAMSAVSPVEMANILGHKTLAMTMRYSHLSPQRTNRSCRCACEADGHLMGKPKAEQVDWVSEAWAIRSVIADISPPTPQQNALMKGGPGPLTAEQVAALAMPSILVSSVPSLAAPPPARRRVRWVGVLAAALALSVASTSAALLVRVGQLERPADQAMFDALRQSPGLSS